jgi:hypothetical protein
LGYNHNPSILFWSEASTVQQAVFIGFFMTNLHLHKKAAIVLIAFCLPFSLPAQTSTAAASTPKITVNAAFPPLTYLTFPGPQYAADFLKYVASSPLIDGVNPPLLWSMVDNGPDAPGGQYDWTAFDAVIQPYIKLGKKVNLTVWSISEAGVNSDNFANHATPAYVMNLVDTVTCKAFPGDGTLDGSYPVMWETPFKHYYKQFIAEVLRHYEDNPHIGYIRFGISGGAAVYPSCETELDKFLPGLTFKRTLLNMYDEIMTFIKSQNPRVPIIGPFAAFDEDLNYSIGETDKSIAEGFGIGYQGLRAADITDYPTCTSDWCRLFSKYSTVKPTPPFELQPVGQTDPSATCTPSCWDGVQQQTGPLPPLLSFAVEHHATVIEIYANDLLLALDPAYPGYADYHTGYQHALSAVHSGKGSSVTLSETTLNFGNLREGASSAPQTITVTNSGSSLLKLDPVTIEGDYAATDDDCSSRNLTPGQHCTISLAFKPTTIGTRGGLLRVHDSDPWSPQTVALNGKGLK